MKKVFLLVLIFIATKVSGQTYKEIGGTGQILNGVYARELLLPDDTVLTRAKNVDTCQQIAKKNGIVYSYNCDSTKWIPVGGGKVPSLQEVTTTGNTTDNVISVTGVNGIVNNNEGLHLANGFLYSGVPGLGTRSNLQLLGKVFTINGEAIQMLSTAGGFGLGATDTSYLQAAKLKFITNSPEVAAEFNSQVSGYKARFFNEYITKEQADSLNTELSNSIDLRYDSTTTNQRYIKNQKAAKQDGSAWLKGITADTFTYKGIGVPDVYSRRSSGVVGVSGQSLTWYPSSASMSYTWWADPTGFDMALRTGTAGVGLWVGRDLYTNSALKVSAQGSAGINNVLTGKDTSHTKYLFNFLVQNNVSRFAFNDSIPRGPYSFYVNSGMGVNKDSLPNDLAANMPLLAIDTITGQIKKRYATGGGGGGITTLNSLSGGTQTFSTGTSGSDFNIASTGTNHEYNMPDAGSAARGVINTGSQSIAGQKTFIDSMSLLNSVRVAVKNAQIIGTDTSGKLVNKTKFYPLNFGDSTGLTFVSGDPSYTFSRMFDPALAGNGHGLTVSDVFRKNANGYAHASFDARTVFGGTANYDHTAPFQDATKYRSTGTLNRYYSFVSSPSVDSGVVSNRIGLYIFDPSVAAGASLVNNYGILIPALGAGSGENYGISSIADVKFSGRVFKRNSTISDTTRVGELLSGTWWQPTSSSGAYIVGAANVASEAGIGYFKGGGGAAYKLAIGIKATNATAQVPVLKLMESAGQVVVADSVPYLGGAKFVVNGSSYLKDTVSLFAQVPLAKFYVNTPSIRFDLGSDATGDLFYRNSSGFLTKLALGASGTIITSNGSAPTWTMPTHPCGPVKDFYTDATGADSLYAFTVPASYLVNNGDKIKFTYAGTFAASGATARILGIAAANTTMLSLSNGVTLGGYWKIEGTIIRVSNSVIRFIGQIYFDNTGVATNLSYTVPGEIGGLNLSANGLRLALTVGSPNTNVTANLGSITYVSAAP